MDKDKLKSYFGFARKMNSIIIGVDNILKFKKNIYATVVSNNLSKNACDKLLNKNITYYVVDDDLFSYMADSSSIKAISVGDKNLAEAIINNIKMEAKYFE